MFDELHSSKYNSDNEIRNITCNGQNLPRESELDNFVQERFFNLIGVCKGPLKVGGFLVFNEASELIRDELYIPNFIINHITSFLGKGKKCLTSVRIETRKEIEEREAKDFHNSLFGDNDVLIDFNCDSPPIHNNDIILIGQSDHVYTYVYE